jgi:hypothetical protein
MAYAILDRTRMRGAFHNTMIPYTGPSGRGRLHHLSIARETLAQSPPPFTEGTVYLLSRDPGERPPQALAAPPAPAPVQLTLRGSSGLRDVFDAAVRDSRANR